MFYRQTSEFDKIALIESITRPLEIRGGEVRVNWTLNSYHFKGILFIIMIQIKSFAHTKIITMPLNVCKWLSI